MEQIYDEKILNDIYNSLVNKAHTGEQMDSFEANMGIITGHALDAYNLSKDLEHPLSFAEISGNDINEMIIAMYMFYKQKGYASTKCRDTITKKIGSYLFFCVCNDINNKPEMAAKPVAMGSGMYLEVNGQDEKPYNVDIFRAVSRFMNKNLKYDSNLEIMVINDPEDLMNSIKSLILEKNE